MKSTFWSILFLALIASVGVFSSILTGEWGYGRVGVVILAIGCIFVHKRSVLKSKPKY